jgi:aspartyl protease family protein
MGLTSVRILIANPRVPERTKEVELLVDTGAMYSMVPSKILRELGVVPEGTRTFTLASGEKIKRKVGGAIYKLDGILGHASVIFGEEGDQPLLGVTALEEMGLQVDPVTRKLKSTELYLL